MSNYTFVNREFFYLLIIPIAILIWYILKYKFVSSTILFSDTHSISKTITLKQRLRHLPYILKIIAAALLIIAIARPQSTANWEESTTEGIDIVLAMDISGSMLARDLKPDRLEASKDVAMDFISKRKNDRVGLVIFAGESFTQCPLTTDHNVLLNLFKDVKSGMVEDGTAIGMGLATAVNRLKDSKAISKVIILLTDGVNNSGMVPPLTAAEIAQKFGIRVYTIGVGTEGFAPYPFQTPFGIQYQDVEVKIDEKTLQDIAILTDGKYFRATNNNSLKEIYKDIDALEKSKIEVTEFHKRSEEFLPFALWALGLLFLGFILQITYLKQIP
jgi:Ca-activated chloride channel homolog